MIDPTKAPFAADFRVEYRDQGDVQSWDMFGDGVSLFVYYAGAGIFTLTARNDNRAMFRASCPSDNMEDFETLAKELIIRAHLDTGYCMKIDTKNAILAGLAARENMHDKGENQ